MRRFDQPEVREKSQHDQDEPDGDRSTERDSGRPGRRYTPRVPTPPDPHLREILEQPVAIRRAADALLEQGREVEQIAEASRVRDRLLLTGMGSSFDAGFPAVEHLAGHGVVALHENSAEVLHFRLPWITARTLLVMVSQSGRSAEVVALAERARADGARPFVVSVTNGLENELAERADVALDLGTGPETAPSSMTFAATLVHLAAIARVAAGDDAMRVCDEIASAGIAAADAVAAVLSDAERIAGTVSAVCGGKRAVVIVGRGPSRATAEMGALTMQECGVAADGFEGGAFRHGPFELAGPGLGAIVVATETRTRPLELGLADDLRATGSDVVVLTDDVDTPPEGSIVLPRVEALLSPAASVVPIQLAAHRLAVEAGREPGSYTFATKVTTRE
jgi:glutamine---fructose-6-phosphate transaminase (isomerizing)